VADEDAKEKDRFAAPPVADQPLHAGESLGKPYSRAMTKQNWR
jgi:hypothetical protein